MAHSPYLSKELKDYIITNEIESKINKAVNEVLRRRPEDPFGALVNLLGSECSPNISLSQVKALEVFNNEFRPTLKFDCLFQYKMAIRSGFSHTYCIVDDTNPQILYDQESPERFEGKGMQKACEIAKDQLIAYLEGVDCNDAKKVDDALKNFFENNQGIGLNITLPLSIITNKAVACLTEIPLYKRLNSAYLETEQFQPKMPQIFICILQGSKIHGSKCKPARFYYIIPEDKTAIEKATLARNLCFGVRKVIASGKLGEGGVKQLTDGSFICPFDTINDNLKMLDEVINQNGVKDIVKIGIEWAAENLFQATAGKYELENPNPKNFLDANQLIDYYVKLCSEKPSIAYMEDPLIPDNRDAWAVLKAKFQGKNVKFGSRKIYNNLENAKKTLEAMKAGDSGMTEEQLKQEHEKRIILDYAVLKYGEFPTLGSFYQVASYLLMQSNSMNVIIQDNYSETEDSFIIDLGVSMNKFSLLLGPSLKSERLAKFNRMIELENSMSS